MKFQTKSGLWSLLKMKCRELNRGLPMTWPLASCKTADLREKGKHMKWKVQPFGKLTSEIIQISIIFFGLQESESLNPAST